MFIFTSPENSVYADVHRKNKERVNFFKKFIKSVEHYDHIFLFPHINPDGDCIGGVLGFKEVLKKNYPSKKIYAVGSNFGLFEWLPQKFDEMPKSFDFSKALAVIIDVGVKARIQQYSEYFEEASTKFGSIVKIDHHESPPDIEYDFGWDDGTYVAACVQLIQLADYYNWVITPKAATYLYLGIYTDSSRFLFPSTLSRSLILAAKAWRAGADYRLLHKKLTLRTWDSISIQQYLLSQAIKEDGIIWFHLTSDIIEKKKIKNTGGLVNTYQNIEGVSVWVMFVDTPEGDVRVEFRSMGADVKTLAMKFGGGGHENASGALIKDHKLIPEIVKAAKELAKSSPISEDKFSWDKNLSEEIESDDFQTPEETLEESKEILSRLKDEE